MRLSETLGVSSQSSSKDSLTAPSKFLVTECAGWPESSTFRVKEKEPFLLGRPQMQPSGVRLRPSGRSPLATLQT